jgi:hypothetical protein
MTLVNTRWHPYWEGNALRVAMHVNKASPERVEKERARPAIYSME